MVIVVYCVRKNIDLSLYDPASHLDEMDSKNSGTNSLEDEIDPDKQEILFKAAYILGKYFLFHKRSLADPKFNDS